MSTNPTTINAEMENSSFKYGLLANNNSLLFTKFPTSLFSSTPLTPPSSPVQSTFSQEFSISKDCGCDPLDKDMICTPSVSSATSKSSSSFLSLKSFASSTSKAFSLSSSFSFSSSTTSFSTSSSIPVTKKDAQVKPQNLGGKPLCPTQLAILDLVTYFDVVNMCVSARTSPVITIENSNIKYTDSLEPSRMKLTSGNPKIRKNSACSINSDSSQVFSDQSRPKRKNIRRIRKFLMSQDVSLACFERKFLQKLMLECFESPFDDEYEYPGPQSITPASPIASSSYFSSTKFDFSNTNINNINTSLSNTTAVSPDMSDSCLHIELIHPVEHGNLHAMLTSILHKDKRNENLSTQIAPPIQPASFYSQHKPACLPLPNSKYRIIPNVRRIKLANSS